MGCVQSYFRKAHNAGLSPSSTHGSEKGGIPQDATADVADLVDRPEKEPLDLNDIQNEDEVIQTEKPNESALEPNGTIKTDDSNINKVIAATGTAAVIGAVAAAAATENKIEVKEQIEDVQVVTQANELTQSPKPSNSESATEVPEDSKSPIDDTVIVDSANSSEIEQKESASTPAPEVTTGTEIIAQSPEEAPSETVPEERSSTAKSEESKEQGSRPVSASDVVIEGKADNSRSTSAVDEEIEVTRTSSASVTKEDSVPDQKEEETSRPQSGDAITPSSPAEPETQSQDGSRPVSVAESVKEASRPASSTVPEERLLEDSEKQIRPGSSIEEPSRPNSIVEGRVVSEIDAEPVKDEENKPTSVTEELIQSRLVSAVESNKEEGSRPESSAVKTDIPEESAENQTISAIEEVITKENSRPVSAVAENSEVYDESSKSRPLSTLDSTKDVEVRSLSAVESNKENETEEAVESQETNASDTAKQESRPESAKSNADVIATESEERSTSVAESIKEEGSQASNPLDSRPVSKVDSIKEDNRPASIVIENVDDTEELSESRQVSVVGSAKEEDSRPTSAVVDAAEVTEEESTSRPVTGAESTKEENSRPTSAALGSGEITEPASSRPVSVAESIKEEGSRPTSAILNTAEISEQLSGSRPVSVAESTKEVVSRPASTIVENTEVIEEHSTDQPVSTVSPAKEEGSRPSSSNVDTTDNVEEQKSSRPESIAESAEEESKPVTTTVDTTEISEEQENSRPVSVAESTKEEILDATELVEQQTSSRPVSVSESTKDGGSRPVSAVIDNSEEPATSRPISVAESIKEAENTIANEVIETVESDEQQVTSRPVSVAESSKNDGSRPVSIAESTKDEESRPASTVINTVEVIEHETTIRPVSVAESTKEEGSRPASVTGSIKEDASRPGSALDDAAKESGSRPTSTIQENASEEQVSSRPVSVSESIKEQGSRPASTIVDTIDDVEESLENAIDSTKEEISRPPSAAVSTEDRPTSVAETTTKEEDGVAESAKAQENDATVTDQEEGSRPASIVESNKEEGSKPASVVAPDEPLKNDVITESQEASSEETKEFVDSVLEQIPLAEETTSSRPPSAAVAEQEEHKQSSRPTSSVQEGAENGRSTAEAENEIRVPSADQPTEVEAEVSEISEDERKLEDEEPTATLEDTAEPESSQILSGSVPSLTVTEIADEPRSDDEIETQAEGEAAKSTEVTAHGEPTARDDKEINSAATTIQASFRGYQTRQSLNKSADISQVQQTSTSHDFLFGPPVEEAAPSAPEPEPEPAVNEQSVTSTPRSPETGEKQPDVDNELSELQKPQECDDLPPPPEDVDIETDADSSVSTAATKIQAGVRGFLTRRQVQQMKTSNSTTAPSIGDSMPSLGDTLTSQEDGEEDDGVQTSGSLETEVQKQHQVTAEDDEVTPQEETSEATEIAKGRSLDSQLNGMIPKNMPVRSAVSLHDGPVNEEEDHQVWQTLQQDVLDNAATKIQSNFRGYRTRRSLKREDAVQIPTTSTSATTASSEVVPEPIRHSGEFHDIMVLPPSPQEDSTDASTSVSGPIQ